MQPGNVTVTATGDGVTLTTNGSAVLRNPLSFTGSAPGSMAGQTIEIERLGHQTNWQWAPTVQATIASDGRFSVVWHTDHIGRFLMRAVLTSASNASATSAASAPTVTTTVYRQSIATQYGPGFYGQRTACGERLTAGRMIGVANRTLKCGTKVAILVPRPHDGRPGDRSWALRQQRGLGSHQATGRALGIGGTATIGAVSLPRSSRGRLSSLRPACRPALVLGHDVEHVKTAGGGGEARLFGGLDQVVWAPPVLAQDGHADAGRQRRARATARPGRPRGDPRSESLRPGTGRAPRDDPGPRLGLADQDVLPPAQRLGPRGRSSQRSRPRAPGSLDGQDSVGVFELGQQQRQRCVPGPVNLLLRAPRPTAPRARAVPSRSDPRPSAPAGARGPAPTARVPGPPAAGARGSPPTARVPGPPAAGLPGPRGAAAVATGGGSGATRGGLGADTLGRDGSTAASAGPARVAAHRPARAPLPRISSVTWARRSASSVIRSGSGSRSSARRAAHTTAWRASTACEVAAAPVGPRHHAHPRGQGRQGPARLQPPLVGRRR